MKPLPAAAIALLISTPVAGQGYRLRLDTRFQSVSFRGVQLDSIPVTDTVTGPGGGPGTADGFAVHCTAGGSHCTFFRPGPRRVAAPTVTTADLALWGIGVRGLSAHATARVGVDLGASDGWPGTSPSLQLLAGHVDYATERLTARAGRQTMFSRLGATGFDGVSVTVRAPRRGLDAAAFAGWQLARGIALPVTSPALNPLDDFQPRQRQLVAGAEAGWSHPTADARVVYQREVDPRSDYFVSERFAVSGAFRPAAGWTVAGGVDYDLAAGWWGSSDLSVMHTTQRFDAGVALRRYRPHFDLWTIWGAFSPVPYRSLRGQLLLRAANRLQLHARGELYEFEPAEVSTPLVQAEREGWRWELGLTATPARGWTVDGGFRREFGPGAAAAGAAGSLSFAPHARYRVVLHGASLHRPLEFRFTESLLRAFGLDADAELNERLRVSVGVSRYGEDRRRPDPSGIDWTQWRVTAGAVLVLARGGDLDDLPPALRRMPGGRVAR